MPGRNTLSTPDCGADPAAPTDFRRAVFARGFDSPVLLTHAPGEPGTVYVVEQTGRVIRVRGSRRTVFLDVRGTRIPATVTA